MNESSVDLSDGPVDRRQLREGLGRFATGVAIVTTRTASGKLEGLTANSFSSVSLDPPLVLWCLRRDAASAPAFAGTGVFAVNVLGAHQHALSRHFSTPTPDKFAGLRHTSGLEGCPLLEDSLAHFECRTVNAVEAGDHVIFIGRVLRLTHRDGEPLIFSGGRYCIPAALAGATQEERT
jgi:flavin reductase (DIM6/NTAB) family NADH-FMN oxidoreductase RutF